MNKSFHLQKTSPFNESISGSFGVSKTSTSFDLNFVLSTLPVARISELETAATALGGQFDSFNDLLQRDIDMERVSSIANEYLENSRPGARFFPPLLVSIIPFDREAMTDGRSSITDQFSVIEETTQDGWIKKTWDETSFEINLASGDGDIKINHEGQIRSVYSTSCMLRWNSRQVKLVVIDGQHRLSAIKKLYNDPEKRAILLDMHIPVCIVFPPNAVKDNPRGERIREILRDLFVTINKTPRTVSGHFLILLDDQSIAAIAMRDLGELWKKSPVGGQCTKLNFLEWNQRSKSRTNQRERQYSISTISIIAAELERSVFSSDAPGLTAAMLNLTEREVELTKYAEYESLESISNRVFHVGQREVISEQAAKYITPALDVLFSQPSPYHHRITEFEAAKSTLDGWVANGVRGAKTFRDECLKMYRQTSPLDGEHVASVEEDFCDLTQPEDHEQLYFSNVFQQGLIRAWAEISRRMLRKGIDPTATASALVAGLEVLALDEKIGFFSVSKSWTLHSLYREGTRFIVTDTARSQWKRLILITFLNTAVRDAFKSIINERLPSVEVAGLDGMINEFASSELVDFEEDYHETVNRFYRRNWNSPGVAETHKAAIENLAQTHGANSDAVFKYIGDKLADAEVQKAIGKLKRVVCDG